MKIDILNRIKNPQEYCEELVYNLNGEFPQYVFLYNYYQFHDLHMIRCNSEKWIEEDYYQGKNNDYLLDFYNKFPCESLVILYENDDFALRMLKDE